jgi:hypothetical protein
VTGIVTMKGAPVEGAVVVFLPNSGEQAALASQAITDSEGRFVMRTHVVKDRYEEGMPPGHYGVTISKLDAVPDMTRSPKNLLPAKYNSVNTSKLSASVEPGGDNVFTFQLE